MRFLWPCRFLSAWQGQKYKEIGLGKGKMEIFRQKGLRNGKMFVILQLETSRVWPMYMGSAKSPPA